MPDITMCSNEQCPLAQKCYRYRATPSCYQYYLHFKPDEQGVCEMYWPTRSQQRLEQPTQDKGE